MSRKPREKLKELERISLYVGLLLRTDWISWSGQKRVQLQSEALKEVRKLAISCCRLVQPNFKTSSEGDSIAEDATNIYYHLRNLKKGRISTGNMTSPCHFLASHVVRIMLRASLSGGSPKLAKPSEMNPAAEALVKTIWESRTHQDWIAKVRSATSTVGIAQLRLIQEFLDDISVSPKTLEDEVVRLRKNYRRHTLGSNEGEEDDEEEVTATPVPDDDDPEKAKLSRKRKSPEGEEGMQWPHIPLPALEASPNSTERALASIHAKIVSEVTNSVSQVIRHAVSRCEKNISNIVAARLATMQDKLDDLSILLEKGKEKK
mmetsp:Transcript_37419/g.96689  ORF Transcript_37419/g.96689 Transcript_37419/m.96689 type:complete len:319 (-) Transcript_37419:222-1178(-)